MKKTRAVFLLALLLLPGCGFRPIYGTHQTADGSSVAEDLNNIAIDNIKDHEGQMLRNDLIDRMYGKNRPATPVYTLKVTLRSTIEELGILQDSTATRSLMNMYGDYELLDGQGHQMLKGTAHSVTGYNRLDQMYGTVASQNDATERTVHEVSEQIVNRLSLYFSERK